MLNINPDDIIKSVQALSTEEKTEFVCSLLENSCLDPHQVYPCLGLDEGMVDQLASKNREFFESEYFHRLQLDIIPTEFIRDYVNEFNVENQ